MGSKQRLTVAGILTLVATAFAPPAQATMTLGNYNRQIVGRYEFHTWAWSISSCTGGCVHVNAIAMPVAKALTVDVPDGLRCDDIYCDPTIPTHDIYTWDATTLAGSLESSFDAGYALSPALCMASMHCCSANAGFSSSALVGSG